MQKNTLWIAALPAIAALILSLTATRGPDRIVLFIFLEALFISCVIPFLIKVREVNLSRTKSLYLSLLHVTVFCSTFFLSSLIAVFFCGLLWKLVLSTLFFLSFAVFMSGVTMILSCILGNYLGQVVGAGTGILIIATPFYLSYVFEVVPSCLRLFFAQWSVNINPLITAYGSILQFDWLRSPRMYLLCPLGGEQFPFYYPSPIGVAIVFAVSGLLLSFFAILIDKKRQPL